MKNLCFFICVLIGCIGLFMASTGNNNSTTQVYCNLSGAILLSLGIIGFEEGRKK